MSNKVFFVIMITLVLSILFLGLDFSLNAFGYVTSGEIVKHKVSVSKYQTVGPGDMVEVWFRVELKGTEIKNAYYVSFYVKAPNGQRFDITYISGISNESDRDSYKMKWTVPPNAPEGWYTARVDVWAGKNGDVLKNRLAHLDITNAFQVKKPPPEPIYYNTQLSLQIKDSTSQGYIKVKPTLTYGSGIELSNDISIYVDRNYKTMVSSNQWSHDIKVGDDSHTIEASVAAWTDKYDSLIKFRASSSGTVDHFVEPPPGPSGPGVTSGGSGSGVTSGGSGPGVTSGGSGVTSSDSSLIEYVVIAVAIVSAAGIGIGLSKRKKVAPMVYASPANIPVAAADDTQFWVCPHCGRDTEYRNGKQFCSSCNVYL